MPRIDVKEILGDPLVVTMLDGTELTIRDIPLKAVMEFRRAQADKREPDAWMVLESICQSVGVSVEQMEAWGTAEAVALMQAAQGHFLALMEKQVPTEPEPTPGTEAEPSAGDSPGPTPSPDSSATSEETQP